MTHQRIFPNIMFLLQIVHPDGTVVRFPAGGPLERELVEAVVMKALSKGIGFTRTEAQVAQAVRAAVTETILDLKLDSRYAVKP